MKPTSYDTVTNTTTPTASSPTLQQLTLQLLFVNTSLGVEDVENSQLVLLAIKTAIAKVLLIDMQAIGDIMVDAISNHSASSMSGLSSALPMSILSRNVFISPIKLQESKSYRISTNISSYCSPRFNENTLNKNLQEFSYDFCHFLAKKKGHKFDCEVSVSMVFIKPVYGYNPDNPPELIYVYRILHQLEEMLVSLVSRYGLILLIFACVYVFYRVAYDDKIKDNDETQEDGRGNYSDSKHTYVEIPTNTSTGDLYSIYPDHDIVRFEYDHKHIDELFQNRFISPLHRLTSDSLADVDFYSVHPENGYDLEASVSSARAYYHLQRSDSRASSNNYSDASGAYDTFNAGDSFQYSCRSASDSSDDENDKFDFWPFF